MTSTMDVLNEKNMHLEKFFRLNEIELEKFTAEDFSGLDEFYKTREGILDIVRKLDEMLERADDDMDPATIDETLKKEILVALDYKNNLVTRIFEQDLRILSVLENAKSNIIKELAQVRGAKKAIGAYHSGQSKTRLNEKA